MRTEIKPNVATKKGMFRRLGNRLHNTEQRILKNIQKGIEKRGTKKKDALLSDPVKHRRAIRKEFKRGYREAMRLPFQDSWMARRNTTQLLMYPNPITHLPIPIPFLPNLLTIPVIPIFHGIPFLTNTLITATLYNMPNTYKAVIERRFVKALGYGGLTLASLLPLPIPLFLNTSTYDIFKNPVEEEMNKQILSRAKEVLTKGDASNPEYHVFLESLQSVYRNPKKRERIKMKLAKRKQLLEKRLQEEEKRGEGNKIANIARAQFRHIATAHLGKIERMQALLETAK